MTQQPEGEILHNPIEDHPNYSKKIDKIQKLIEREMKDEITREHAKLTTANGTRVFDDLPYGSCHELWARMKDRLAAEGITWYSVGEMNPGVLFDSNHTPIETPQHRHSVLS